MDGANALALLGLEPSASGQDVARAFRAAAKRCHPDHGGDRHEFEQVFAAYETLRSLPPPRKPNPFLSFEPTTRATFDAYDTTRRPPAPRRRSFAEELRTAMAA